MDETRVLAICGSLRAQSWNLALTRELQRLAPAGMEVELYERLRELPLYDQDLDTEDPPEPVADLRARIAAADGLLIVTPEYNYSLPGGLKNAIDWASRMPGGTPVLAGTPSAIAGAAPTNFGSVRAQLALRQVLLWTNTPVVTKPELIVFRAQERFDEHGSLVDETTIELARGLMSALADLVALHANARPALVGA
jgi:chromate reductase